VGPPSRTVSFVHVEAVESKGHIRGVSGTREPEVSVVPTGLIPTYKLATQGLRPGLLSAAPTGLQKRGARMMSNSRFLTAARDGSE
jgi:hypothetical protein